MNKVTLKSFVVPVTLDRKVGSFDIWGLDKTDRVSYYVQGGIGVATVSTTANMVSGLVTECKASANPSKAVKGQEITFTLKAEASLPYGAYLRWFDNTATTNFQFTSGANAAEILCGTTSLGSTTVLNTGTSAINVVVPAVVAPAISEAGACAKETTVSAKIREYTTAIADATDVADITLNCMVCDDTTCTNTATTAADANVIYEKLASPSATFKQNTTAT